MSMAVSFIQLYEIPITFANYVAKPIYCDSPNQSLIIATSSNDYEENAGIYHYQFNTNRMSLITKYDDSIKLADHGAFSDHENDKLYLIGGNHESFYSMNRKTKIFTNHNFNKTNINCKWDDLPIITSIPSPINEIHVMGRNKHFKFNINNQNISQLNENKNKNIEYPKLIYIEIKKQLIIFGSDKNDTIFYKNISENEAEWNEYPLTMPYNVDDTLTYDILLAFNSLLFVFYFNSLHIYCLDIINIKWYQSHVSVPKSMEDSYGYVIKTKHNTAHLMDFYSGDHFEISVYDLIPADLKIMYSKYYSLLVFGYIKENENNLIIPTIPFVLKQLICLYFPLFI